MISTKDQIAARLEHTFATRGFAEPGVAELKKLAGISLRTLYRYFPSKEAMVIGALQHRHERYLKFLAENSPGQGRGSMMHLFTRLGDWMVSQAPNGCLYLDALASFPGNNKIRELTRQHKAEIIQLIANRSGKQHLAQQLFLIHEGATAGWPVIGRAAIETAKMAVGKIMGEGVDE